MVRIDGKRCWLFLPALTVLFIGGKPSEGFEPLGELISHQEGVEVLFQGLMSLVIVRFDRGFLEGSVHALDPPIGPGLMGCGQPMCNGACIACSCKDVVEGLLILLPICILDAIIGEDSV
jgi:hypothetical protein